MQTTKENKRVNVAFTPQEYKILAQKSELEKTLLKMFFESTGSAMCDSGGEYDRQWQRARIEGLKAFLAQPDVEFESSSYHETKPERIDVDDVSFTVNGYAYLKSVLELDDVCKEFNSKFAKMQNWDSDAAYGLSKDAELWIEGKARELDFECGESAFGKTWNSYNGEEVLNVTIQGCNIKLNGERYVLIQLHRGCDVRGGYTDAKLFKLPSYHESFMFVSISAWDNEKRSFQSDGTRLTLVEGPEGAVKIEELKGEICL